MKYKSREAMTKAAGNGQLWRNQIPLDPGLSVNLQGIANGMKSPTLSFHELL
jgi:hypothetical protein